MGLSYHLKRSPKLEKLYKSLLTGEEFVVALRDGVPLAQGGYTELQRKLQAMSKAYLRDPTIRVVESRVEVILTWERY